MVLDMIMLKNAKLMMIFQRLVGINMMTAAKFYSMYPVMMLMECTITLMDNEMISMGQVMMSIDLAMILMSEAVLNYV